MAGEVARLVDGDDFISEIAGLARFMIEEEAKRIEENFTQELMERYFKRVDCELDVDEHGFVRFAVTFFINGKSQATILMRQSVPEAVRGFLETCGCGLDRKLLPEDVVDCEALKKDLQDAVALLDFALATGRVPGSEGNEGVDE